MGVNRLNPMQKATYFKKKALAYLAKYTNETEDLQSQGNKKAVQYTGKNSKINDICYELEQV